MASSADLKKSNSRATQVIIWFQSLEGDKTKLVVQAAEFTGKF